MDKRIAKAAAFKMLCQDASIPEAMRASKFTLAKSLNPAKQMAVRRAYEKAIGSKTKAPITVSITTKSTGSSLSLLSESPRTKSTAKTGTQTPERHDDAKIQLKPKARQIRNTASGMQKWRVNKFDSSDHNKRAFKRATSWYYRELQKGNAGLSSYEIAKRLKREFDGAGPCARTIQRYANTGLAGLSPLKPGVKSDIPKWAYSSLCTAFKSYVRINQVNRIDDVQEKMNKSQMVAKWKVIRLNHVPPPTFEKWGDSDEEELIRLKMTEVDTTETALGRYAALMKRPAFSSVLDFTDEEWISLNKLRDEASMAVATTAEATDETWMDAIEEPGELERDNTMIGGENGKGMV